MLSNVNLSPAYRATCKAHSTMGSSSSELRCRNRLIMIIILTFDYG